MTGNTIYSEELEQLITIANDHQRHIGYTMVADILKEHNKSITLDDVQLVASMLAEKGITVEPFDEAEDYVSGTTPQLEGAFVPADVNIRQRSMTVDAILERLKYNEIDLSPGFQRRPDLWSPQQQSRLVESLMLRIPLPAFYFDATNDDQWVVIDGLQRLTAFKKYMVDLKMSLSGLEYLTELNDTYFNNLPRQYIRRIKESQLNVYTVEKGTPDAVVYNIFKRINTGGITLEPEEIRHALYRGKATDLVEKLAVSEPFRIATGGTISSQRMLNCEYVTRFFAFTEQDPLKEYQGSIDSFLNSGLKKINRYSSSEIEILEERFYRVMNACHSIFGKYAFRRIGSDGRRGPMNKAIFELWAICLSPLSEEALNLLISKRMQLTEGFNLLLENVAFSSAIKAGDKYSVAVRILETQKLLEGILND